MDKRGKIPVCVFAKPPIPGQVKTRLAPAVGAEGAAMLAQRFFEDIWNSLGGLSWARPIIASTHAGYFDTARELWLQGEGNLGTRMERVLQRALREAPVAIAIGADSPGMPLRLLETARTSLTQADAVLGPSKDGGFYLVGLKSCPRGLLSGIGWSQPHTCAQTLRRLQHFGMSVALLESWFDVDTPDDLKQLKSLIRNGKLNAPRTTDLLNTPGSPFTCCEGARK